MLSFLGFGSRRRRSTKKSHRKVPSKLMKLAKRYHVKTSMKRGAKRVMKTISSIKKAIAKKIRSLIKRSKRKAPARRKKTVRRKTVRRRRSGFGEGSCGASAPLMPAFGSRSRKSRPRKVSKSKAMAAFRKFYRQHCKSNIRRSRFGNGGNPMLSQSMGSEFCSGGGGVLGANSTGLFYSPCMAETAPAETAAAFGRRRRSRAGAMTAPAFGLVCSSRRRRSSPVRRRRSRAGAMTGNKMHTEFGKRRRRSSPVRRRSRAGAGYGATSMMFGKRRRRRSSPVRRRSRAGAGYGATSMMFGKRRRRRSSPVMRRRSRVGNMTMFGADTKTQTYVMGAKEGTATGIGRISGAAAAAAAAAAGACPVGKTKNSSGVCVFGKRRRRRSSPVRRRRSRAGAGYGATSMMFGNTHEMMMGGNCAPGEHWNGTMCTASAFGQRRRRRV